jgi:peptidyl-prolyl cis-trans isomerase C
MKMLTEKAEREFLESYVVPREVLYQEAKRKGLDKDKEIQGKVEDFRRQLLTDALVEEALRGKMEVSDSEIEKYYKENSDRFTEPREVKVRHIVVSSELVLREVLARLAQGVRFETLAQTYNIDRSGADGGTLGYIRRGQLDPRFTQFEEAAFSLKNKGDVSEVVKTPYGFHIIQLEDKRGTALRPLDQVKEKIRFYLQTKKKQDVYLAYVRGMTSKAKVTINEELWVKEHEREEKERKEKANEVTPKEGKK